MFTIIEDPQFTEDVAVEVPDGRGGWQRQQLTTRFRALTLSQLAEVDDAGGDTVAELLSRAVIGFDGLVDGGGKALDGSGAWRARLLDYPFIRAALVKAYYAALTGARSGNSAPSAGPGPKAA